MSRSPGFRRLFDRGIGIALDRQAWLTERIGEASWGFDMGTGAMTFTLPSGEEIVTACQILGTESEITRTWLWGWANEQSGIPGRLLEVARGLGRAGADRDVPELSTPSFPLGEVDGHQIAVVASAVHRAAGYYRAPYEGGALFVLLTGPELEEPAPLPLVRFATGWSRVCSAVPDQVTDQRAAVRAYAAHLGLTAEDQDRQTIRVFGVGGEARVQFDALDRTAAIEASATP